MSAPGYPARPASRPLGVAILAILVILIGVLIVIAGIGMFLVSGFIGLSGLPTFGLAGSIVAAVVLIVGLIWIGVGLGLWHLRSWAWWLAIIVMILSLLGGFPSPTIILPLIILIYLVLVRQHFH